MTESNQTTRTEGATASDLKALLSVRNYSLQAKFFGGEHPADVDADYRTIVNMVCQYEQETGKKPERIEMNIRDCRRLMVRQPVTELGYGSFWNTLKTGSILERKIKYSWPDWEPTKFVKGVEVFDNDNIPEGFLRVI